MATIKLTAKGLAKYMTGRPAQQRKILRDYKFPVPEGAVQIKYYAEARRAIEAFHGSANDPAVLAGAVDALRIKAMRSAGKVQQRLQNNIRALEAYLKNFGKEKFAILRSPDLRLTYGQVVVSAIPDLYVEHGKRHLIVKLDFGKEQPAENLIKIVLQVIFMAADSIKLGVRPQDVVYLDVTRGVQHCGARIRAKLSRDVEAACQTIEDLWPRL